MRSIVFTMRALVSGDETEGPAAPRGMQIAQGGGRAFVSTFFSAVSQHLQPILLNELDVYTTLGE